MSYEKAGVSIKAADQWVEFIKGAQSDESSDELQKKLLSRLGEYASVYKAYENDDLTATTCDGIGTKLIWALEGLGSPEALAQDLFGMNVNDLLCVGARPRLFLDYIAFSSEKLLGAEAFLGRFIQSLNKICLNSGTLLAGGETAQMKGLYQENECDIAGFSVGFLSQQEFLRPENMREKDELWAWSSSGPHSNGYTWLRSLFDSKKDKDLIEEHFMTPTALYVNSFFKLKDELRKMNSLPALKAAFHITGGGYLNLLRGQADGQSLGFDLEDFPEELPAWALKIKERSQSSEEELFRTFNMGFGFAMVLDAQFSKDSQDFLKSLGLQRLGKVVPKKQILLRGMTLTES